MSDGEFNPNSYDAVFSGLKTELQEVKTSLDDVKDTVEKNNERVINKVSTSESNLYTRITELEAHMTRSITEVNNKVIALEYFKWYLTGIATAGATLGSLLLTFLIEKFFGGHGTPPPTH